MKHIQISSFEKPLQEKCGIVAYFTPKLTRQLQTALTAAGGVQHRGQHGAGLAMQTSEGLKKYTGSGLLKDVFAPSVIKRFDIPSRWTMIHCRYGTYGSYREENLQPCTAATKSGSTVAVIHNGEFAAVSSMRRKIKGNLPKGISDTYVFTKLLSQIEGSLWDEKVLSVFSHVNGAYSMAIGVDDMIFLARDQFGIRPFIIGRIADGWIAVSETHALDKLGINVEREIQKGEIIKIDKDGLHILKKGTEGKSYFCDFEWAYFSRPNSRLPTHETKNIDNNPDKWLSVSSFREKCGSIIAKEHPIPNASFVVGVPDSGIAVANGYANAKKIPYRQVIIRDHFDPNGNQRLFMRDDQKDLIRTKVLGKLSFVHDTEIWKNAVVVIGDDSIVRGNVTKEITKAIFELGAKEIHWIIGFPPVTHRCHLGVSMRTREELIASRHDDVKTINDEIGATSVHYISKKGFIHARLLASEFQTPKNKKEIFLSNGGCGGCTTGLYPISRSGKIFQPSV